MHTSTRLLPFFLGWLIADEHVNTQKIIGLTIVIAGLVIVNFSKEKKVADNKDSFAKTESEDLQASLAGKEAS